MSKDSSRKQLKVTVSQIYDTKKWIESVMCMEKIREGIYDEIYLDMDGVLADFFSGLEER